MKEGKMEATLSFKEMGDDIVSLKMVGAKGDRHEPKAVLSKLVRFCEAKNDEKVVITLCPMKEPTKVEDVDEAPAPPPLEISDSSTRRYLGDIFDEDEFDKQARLIEKELMRKETALRSLRRWVMRGMLEGKTIIKPAVLIRELDNHKL
jgi:hypothetical protein